MSETCKRWWSDPDYRVSHVSVAWKQGTRKRQLGHGANIRFISDNMHSSTGHRLGGYTFEACVSKWVEFNEGSSGTRAVVEVVVPTTVVEVVVHGRCGSSR